jgi:hypothetical protein
MTRLASRALLLLAVVVTPGTMSSPALGACVAPAGSVTSTPVSSDGTQRIFSGVIYPFGAVQGALVIHPNADGSFTGQFVMQARGGLVFGTIAGYFTSPATYVETITFAGGTGKYAGISGGADVTGAFNADGTATDTVTGGQVCLW